VPETGGNVTFTFLVENIGQEDVTLTSLIDTKSATLTQGHLRRAADDPDRRVVQLHLHGLARLRLAHRPLQRRHGHRGRRRRTEDTDDDDETVTFDDVAPAIQITKTASPTHVPETGGNVTFTFLVRTSPGGRHPHQPHRHEVRRP